MKILQDECLPRRLRRALSPHQVITAKEQGWGGIKNGTLLTLAGTAFDVFITVDRGLRFQQNLAALPIAVIVLQAKSNKYDALVPLIPQILEALRYITKGQIIQIS